MKKITWTDFIVVVPFLWAFICHPIVTALVLLALFLLVHAIAGLIGLFSPMGKEPPSCRRNSFLSGLIVGLSLGIWLDHDDQ